jgi:hypothetical protein
LLVQQAEADKALHELLRQQGAFKRNVKNAKRYTKSPRELARLLAEVPPF